MAMPPWAKILNNWRTLRDEGRTEREYWWPEACRQAYQNWGGVEPDRAGLACDTTCEGTRGNLKSVPALT